MNRERVFKIILGPVVSEKAAAVGEATGQVVLKVAGDAKKEEIKAAVESLFSVKVLGVRVLNVKGKTKRTRHGVGVRSDWKKAYVRLEQGQDIDFAFAE
jgi:large subunit ribosomal protein L23